MQLYREHQVKKTKEATRQRLYQLQRDIAQCKTQEQILQIEKKDIEKSIKKHKRNLVIEATWLQNHNTNQTKMKNLLSQIQSIQSMDQGIDKAQSILVETKLLRQYSKTQNLVSKAIPAKDISKIQEEIAYHREHVQEAIEAISGAHSSIESEEDHEQKEETLENGKNVFDQLEDSYAQSEELEQEELEEPSISLAQAQAEYDRVARELQKKKSIRRSQ